MPRLLPSPGAFASHKGQLIRPLEISASPQPPRTARGAIQAHGHSTDSELESASMKKLLIGAALSGLALTPVHAEVLLSISQMSVDGTSVSLPLVGKANEICQTYISAASRSRSGETMTVTVTPGKICGEKLTSLQSVSYDDLLVQKPVMQMADDSLCQVTVTRTWQSSDGSEGIETAAPECRLADQTVTRTSPNMPPTGK